MEIEEERYLRDLKADDPALYRQIMAERLGIGKQNDIDPLEQFLETATKLQRVSRIFDHGNARGHEKEKNVLLEALGEVREMLDTEGGKQLGEAAKIAVAHQVGALPAPSSAPAQQATQQQQAPQPAPAQAQQSAAPNGPAPGQPPPEITAQIHARIQQITSAIEPPGQPRVDPAKAAETMQKLAMAPELLFPSAPLVKSLITDARNLEPTKAAVATYLQAQMEQNPGHRELWEWFGASMERLEWLFALVLVLHGETTPTPNGHDPAATAGI